MDNMVFNGWHSLARTGDTAAAVMYGSPGGLAPVGQRLLEEGDRLLLRAPLLGLALLVIVAAWWVGGWISRRALFGRVAYRNAFLVDLVRTTVRWAILAAGVLVALEILNATALVGAVLGTAGVLGVVLGFAFKDILENYLAGILMSLRQPFAPQDFVSIESQEGVVVALNSRSTVLMTLDGNHVRLPNALVFRSVIVNYTRNPRRRFTVEVGVGSDEDLARAQELGSAEVRGIEGVLSDPPPRALVQELGDSNVQVRFHGWVDQRSHDYLSVRSEAIRRVKLALDAAGVGMPEPTYRVRLDRTVAAVPDVPPRLHGGPAPDTSATTDITRQIEIDGDVHPTDNLLDPAAPRE